MSDNNAPEPTMEEILASIRRIISEDDTPAAPPPQPTLVEEPVSEPLPTFAEGDDDDVLELTDPVAAEPAPEPPPPPPRPAPKPAPVAAMREQLTESLGDLDVFSRAPSPPPRPAPAPAPEPDDGLISAPAADLAASAFGQLSRSLAMPAEGRTLEDVVRELMRPMLKDWLDRNLSGIVETAVQAEVERISRQRRF
jgi:cell pole-organizing protein PopZ